MKKYFTVLVLSILAFSPLIGRALDWNYITLSSYYVFPSQSVTVQGFGFDPNESVTISLGNTSTTAHANSSGQFTSSPFAIPYSLLGSHVAVTARGNSGRTTAAELAVGSYYPHVEPSNYYLPAGGTITFTGRHFAPNESVIIKRDGETITTLQADNEGNIYSGNIQLPHERQDQTFIFTGKSSGTHDTVTIHVAQWTPVVTMDNYYNKPGQTVTIHGQGFGANEPVAVTTGLNTVNAMTNNAGMFDMLFTIPSSSHSADAIVSMGENTSATGSTTFTYNLQGSGPAMPAVQAWNIYQ